MNLDRDQLKRRERRLRQEIRRFAVSMIVKLQKLHLVLYKLEVFQAWARRLLDINCPETIEIDLGQNQNRDRYVRFPRTDVLTAVTEKAAALRIERETLSEDYDLIARAIRDRIILLTDVILDLEHLRTREHLGVHP